MGYEAIAYLCSFTDGELRDYLYSWLRGHFFSNHKVNEIVLRIQSKYAELKLAHDRPQR